MCQTEQIEDKIQYNMDEKGFYIWTLLWFHFSSITLFSLATGIKYSKYIYKSPEKKNNEAFKTWAYQVLVVRINFMTSNRTR